MAEKKNKYIPKVVKNNNVKADIGILAELDTWESELDGFSFSDPVNAKSRKPKSIVKDGIANLFRSTLRGIGQDIYQRTKNKLPNVSELIDTSKEVMDEAGYIRDQFGSDIQPLIRDLNSLNRTIQTRAGEKMPRSAAKIIDKILKKATKEEYTPPSGISKEAQEQATIDSALGQLFTEQFKYQVKLEDENKKDKLISKNIEKFRHDQTAELLNKIRIHTEEAKLFQKVTFTAYMKKDLELKYKHLFVAKETLATIQAVSKVFETKFNTLIYNASLPDYQKRTLFEKVKQGSMDALFLKGNGFTLQDIIRRGVSRVKNATKDFTNQANLYSSMLGSMSSMPGVGGAAMAMDAVGSILSTFIGGQISDILFGKGALGRNNRSPLGGQMHAINEGAKHFQYNLLNRMMEIQRDEAGTRKAALLEMLMPSKTSITNKANDPNASVMYDSASRTALVAIIPGLLSRILQQTTQLNTGQPAPLLVYDHSKQQFTTQEAFQRKTNIKMMRRMEDRGEALGRAVGSIQAAYTQTQSERDQSGKITSEAKIPEEYIPDINRVLVNLEALGQGIPFEQLKRYVTLSTYSLYFNPLESNTLKQMFSGVGKTNALDDPRKRAVAKILLQTAYKEKKGILNNTWEQNSVAKVNLANRIDLFARSGQEVDRTLERVSDFGQAQYISGILDYDTSGSSFNLNTEKRKSLLLHGAETDEYKIAQERAKQDSNEEFEYLYHALVGSPMLFQVLYDLSLGNPAPLKGEVGRIARNFAKRVRDIYQNPDEIRGFYEELRNKVRSSGGNPVNVYKWVKRIFAVKGKAEQVAHLFTPQGIMETLNRKDPEYEKRKAAREKLEAMYGDNTGYMEDLSVYNNKLPPSMQAQVSVQQSRLTPARKTTDTSGGVSGKLVQIVQAIQHFEESFIKFTRGESLGGSDTSPSGGPSEPFGPLGGPDTGKSVATDTTGDASSILAGASAQTSMLGGVSGGRGSTSRLRTAARQKLLAGQNLRSNITTAVRNRMAQEKARLAAIVEEAERAKAQAEQTAIGAMTVRATSALGKFKAGNIGSGIGDLFNKRFGLGPKFVDIYSKEIFEDENAEPILTAEQQKSGRYVQRVSRKKTQPITSSFDIEYPVIDAETGNYVITKDIIRDGIFDNTGKDITKRSFNWHVTDKTAKATKFALSNSLNLTRMGIKYGLKAALLSMGLYGQLYWMLGKFGWSLTKGIMKGIFNTKVGGAVGNMLLGGAKGIGKGLWNVGKLPFTGMKKLMDIGFDADTTPKPEGEKKPSAFSTVRSYFRKMTPEERMAKNTEILVSLGKRAEKWRKKFTSPTGFLGKLFSPMSMGIMALAFHLLGGADTPFGRAMDYMRDSTIWKAIAPRFLDKPVNALKNKLLERGGKKAAEIAAERAGKVAVTKAAEKVGKTAATQIGKQAVEAAAKKGAGTILAKTAAKVSAKAIAKAVPGAGAIAGIAFAIPRLLKGDFTGAALEVLSGLAGSLPGIGTAASVAISGYLGYRDFKEEMGKESAEKEAIVKRNREVGLEGSFTEAQDAEEEFNNKKSLTNTRARLYGIGEFAKKTRDQDKAMSAVSSSMIGGGFLQTDNQSKYARSVEYHMEQFEQRVWKCLKEGRVLTKNEHIAAAKQLGFEIVSSGLGGMIDDALNNAASFFNSSNASAEQEEDMKYKYWLHWYNRRFMPMFEVYRNMLRSVGRSITTVNMLTFEQRCQIAEKLDAACNKIWEKYKDLVPTEEAYGLYLKKIEQQMKEAKQPLTAVGKIAEMQKDLDSADVNYASSVDVHLKKKYLTPDNVSGKSDGNGGRINEYGERVFVDTNKPSSSTGGGAGSNMPTATPTAPVPTTPSSRSTSPSQLSPNTGGGSDKPLTAAKGNYTVDPNKLGKLVTKFESGKEGSAAIGYDSNGGTSYGKYQIASNTGTFKAFLKWVKNQGAVGQEIARRLSVGPANTGSRQGRVPDAWRALAAEGKFGDLEYQFIKHSHYDVAYRLLSPELKALVDSSGAFKEALWSGAIQHGAGGIAKIWKNAYALLAARGPVDPKALISTIYNLRGGNFKSSTGAVRASVKGRFREEASIILAAYEQEGHNGGSVTSSTGQNTADAATDTAKTAINAPDPATTVDNGDSATPQPTVQTTPEVRTSTESATAPTTPTVSESSVTATTPSQPVYSAPSSGSDVSTSAADASISQQNAASTETTTDKLLSLVLAELKTINGSVNGVTSAVNSSADKFGSISNAIKSSIEKAKFVTSTPNSSSSGPVQQPSSSLDNRSDRHSVGNVNRYPLDLSKSYNHVA